MNILKKSLLKGSCFLLFLCSLSNMGGVLLSREIDLKDRLILYLPMNGNADDESGMEVPTHIEGPSPTTDRFDNPNQAYHYDGIDDYIMLNNNQTLITEKQFTICMWAKINERSQAGDGYNNTLFEQFNNDGNFHSEINRVSIGALHSADVVTGAFNGSIDEVYIYNRALNFCEIEILYSLQLLNER